MGAIVPEKEPPRRPQTRMPEILVGGHPSHGVPGHRRSKGSTDLGARTRSSHTTLKIWPTAARPEGRCRRDSGNGSDHSLLLGWPGTKKCARIGRPGEGGGNAGRIRPHVFFPSKQRRQQRAPRMWTEHYAHRATRIPGPQRLWLLGTHDVELGAKVRRNGNPLGLRSQAGDNQDVGWYDAK